MTTQEVAHRLVALCKEFKFIQAAEELYSDGIVSVEAMPINGVQETAGKANVLKNAADWVAAHHINAASVEGPFLGTGKFSAIFDFDVTIKATGERRAMREVALYTVENGKITREEFYYGS